MVEAFEDLPERTLAEALDNLVPVLNVVAYFANVLSLLCVEAMIIDAFR